MTPHVDAARASLARVFILQQPSDWSCTPVTFGGMGCAVGFDPLWGVLDCIVHRDVHTTVASSLGLRPFPSAVSSDDISPELCKPVIAVHVRYSGRREACMHSCDFIVQQPLHSNCLVHIKTYKPRQGVLLI